MKKTGHVKAYLTVYLAITLAVLVSLCLALIEGVRSNAIRLEAECVMDIGMNSILAEYHRELFAQYNLFAIDSSYGTGDATKSNVEQHLQQYLERNLSTEDIFLENYLYRDFLAMSLKEINMTKASLLTDGQGTVFRRRAVEAVREDVGIALLEQLQQWIQTVESNKLTERDIAAEKQAIDEEIAAYDGMEIPLSETEWYTVHIDNPTKELETTRRTGILGLVTNQDKVLSEKALNPEGLIAARMEAGEINRGNTPLENQTGLEYVEERFLFQEYLLQYMGSYTKEKENSALSYQLEYVLIGNKGDVENLRSVVNRLCALREVANAVYLFSDEDKCAVAEAVGTALAALVMLPEIADLLKVTLLFGWAYAESIYDVKTLLAGGRIPLLKDSTSWHYGLQAALLQDSLGEGGETEGLSYDDYLRIFLMLMDLEVMTGRAMDMVEADIRGTPGNEAFRLDGCYDSVEMLAQIKSAYGYEYEIKRLKSYE